MNDLEKFLQMQAEKSSSAIESFANGGTDNSYEDKRFWKLGKLDPKTGNASAIIKFLPFPTGEYSYDFYDHSFTVNGRWYIENSLSSIGQPDPLMELNKEMWDSGNEDVRNMVRKRSRRKAHISNIYVVKDPANPENNGKVFLYRYGKMIKEKLAAIVKGNPELGEPGVDLFMLNSPYVFALIYTKDLKSKTDFGNYHESKVRQIEPFPPNLLLEIYNNLYPIDNVVKYKSYEELQNKLNYVVGNSTTHKSKSIAQTPSEDLEEFGELDLFNIDELPTIPPNLTSSVSIPVGDDDLDFMNLPF